MLLQIGLVSEDDLHHGKGATGGDLCGVIEPKTGWRPLLMYEYVLKRSWAQGLTNVYDNSLIGKCSGYLRAYGRWKKQSRAGRPVGLVT